MAKKKPTPGKLVAPRLGRPPKPASERRRQQPRPLFIQLTPAERAELDAAAARAAAPISAWARELLLRAARRRA